MNDASPRVSVVLPVLNEAGEIDEALTLIAGQTYGDFEVLVADGGSTDSTREIVERWIKRDSRVQLVHNPRRLQSAGLNSALSIARGDYLVRLDGHSFVEADYVERCVSLLDDTGADVVGGRMEPRTADSIVAKGIGLANRSRWGAGPARFHVGGSSGPAETVYLGAFRAGRVRSLGGWAEDVGVNEDFELNHRVRQAGGVVWLDVNLAVGYRPRGSFGSVARQYFRYGRSKVTVMRRHPSSARLRQVLPALLLPAALTAASRRLRPLAGATVATHVAVVSLGAARSGQDSPRVRIAAAIAALAMHWSWSAGFWWGLAKPFPRAGRPR